MSETKPPDFDEIGRVLAAEAGYSGEEHAGRRVAASIAGQLRLVWNARGAADLEVSLGRTDIERAIRRLDR